VAAGVGGSTFGSPGDIFSQPGPVGFSDPAPAAPASQYPPELLVALQGGRMIEAIKIYRQVTGASLKEARSACEALARGGLP
jgi:ribosomal protein L7/L12